MEVTESLRSYDLLKHGVSGKELGGPWSLNKELSSHTQFPFLFLYIIIYF